MYRSKQFLSWLVIAFIVFTVYAHPTKAGHAVHGAAGVAKHGAHSLMAFFDSAATSL